MKLCLLIPLAILALASSAPALEVREFWNKDKTKSFKASLVGYSGKTRMVTVSTTSGRQIKFKIETLCKEDRDYIQEKAPALSAARNLIITMTEWTGEKTTRKTKSTRLTTTKAGYSIAISNRGDKLDKLTVRYTIFYKKGKLKGKSSTLREEGEFELASLRRNKQDSGKTEPVRLERYIRKPRIVG